MHAKDDDLARIASFLRTLEIRRVDRVEEFEWGRALFTPTFPDVWDLNFLSADSAPRAAPAETLVGEAHRLQGGAGLRHRKVVVHDGPLGDQLAGGFRAVEWEVTKLVVMVHRRDPDAPVRPGAAREVDHATIAPAREIEVRSFRDGSQEEDVVRQLLGIDAVMVERIGTRFFAAEDGGRVVSHCDLYSDGSTAQIESVGTLPDFRNRGFARAVVLGALDAARASGCDLVFLIADEEDWPKLLYEKLGFDRVGHHYEFLRPTPGLPKKSADPSGS